MLLLCRASGCYSSSYAAAIVLLRHHDTWEGLRQQCRVSPMSGIRHVPDAVVGICVDHLSKR